MKQCAIDIVRALRATAVLVATLVGAGYATGREMSQYFGVADTATVWLAAVLIAVFSMAFLYVGARSAAKGGRWLCLYESALGVLAAISCGVMISAGKTLLDGQWTALFVGGAGVCLCLSDKVYHWANLCAVPLLLGVIVVATLGAPNAAVGTAFLPLSAANYAGMNLLFEGELLRQEGKGMSNRAIVLAGVGIAVCMGVLLASMHRMVGASPSSLPFADVCAAQGKEGLVQAAILVSVLTSIGGGMRLCLNAAQRWLPTGVAAMTALLAALAVATVPFADLVRVVYPVMGWLGVGVVCVYGVVAVRVMIGGKTRQKWGKRGVAVPQRGKKKQNGALCRKIPY